MIEKNRKKNFIELDNNNKIEKEEKKFKVELIDRELKNEEQNKIMNWLKNFLIFPCIYNLR